MTVDEFATLYDQHERAVYNFCLRLTGSAEDAADATQETFVKVFERLPKLDERELNAGAYVMTVARHASYDLIARRRRSTPADDLPEFRPVQEAHREPRPARRPPGSRSARPASPSPSASARCSPCASWPISPTNRSPRSWA